jgi:GAF domain-containing protein
VRQFRETDEPPAEHPPIPFVAIAASPPDVRAFVAELPSSVALLEGPEHLVTAASSGYRSLIGGDDPCGRRFAEVHPAIAQDGVPALLTRLYLTGEPISGTRPIESLGGGTLPHRRFFDYVYQPIQAPGGRVWGIIAQFHDATDRVRAELEREFLGMVTDVLASSIDYEATLTAVTELAVQGTADWCAIDELDDEGTIRRISVAHPDPKMVRLAHELMERYPVDANAPHGAARVIRTGELEFVREIPDELIIKATRDEEHLRIVRALGLTSYISVPLIARDRVLGALTLVTSGPAKRFDDRDLRVAGEIARRAAVAIDNARLHRESEQARGRLEEQAIQLEVQAEELLATQAELELSNDELQHANAELEERIAESERAVAVANAASDRLVLLAEAGALLGSQLDYQATLNELAQLVVPRIADWCFVEMVDDDGSVELVALHHEDPGRTALAREAVGRYPVDRSAPHGSAAVLRTGEPELVPEVPDTLLEAVAQDSRHLAILRDVGFRSYLSVPLQVRGRIVGVLSLVAGESGRRLGEADLSLAQELGRRAALAIDNAWLYAAENEARHVAESASDRSRRLQEIASALNQATTPSEVADVCVFHGIEALQADAGSLALLSDDRTAFEIVSTSGFADEVADRWRSFPLVPGKPVSDAVILRTPVILGTRADWNARYPHVLPDVEAAGTIGFATIPLVVATEVVAGLSFGFSGEKVFEDADRRFLTTLGEQAAQALERARLFEAESQARTEAELANRAKTDFL